MPVARSIISQISIVEQEKITHMIVIPKNEKHVVVIRLIEQHKDKTHNDKNGKSHQLLTHLTMHMHEVDYRSVHRPIGHVREEFEMRHGKIGKQAWL